MTMHQGGPILVAADAGIAVRSFEDIGEVLGACAGASGILLTEADLGPEFFELRSGLAGQLLQKFVNYRVRVAITVLDAAQYGERFVELVYEHRTHSLIRFYSSQEAAERWLLRPGHPAPPG